MLQAALAVLRQDKMAVRSVLWNLKDVPVDQKYRETLNSAVSIDELLALFHFLHGTCFNVDSICKKYNIRTEVIYSILELQSCSFEERRQHLFKICSHLPVGDSMTNLVDVLLLLRDCSENDTTLHRSTENILIRAGIPPSDILTVSIILRAITKCSQGQTKVYKLQHMKKFQNTNCFSEFQDLHAPSLSQKRGPMTESGLGIDCRRKTDSLNSNILGSRAKSQTSEAKNKFIRLVNKTMLCNRTITCKYYL